MNELAFQLMSLQYELAMNMSSTLDLEGMLRSVIEALLRRLDGRAAAVFELSNGGGRPQLRVAVPSDSQASVELVDAVSSAHTHALAPHVQTLPDGAFRHVFELPGFGILALEHLGEELNPRVHRALRPVMARLGRAALACANHGSVLAAERRFSTLVETLPEVVFEARIEAPGTLQFEYVSPLAHKVLGVEASELFEGPERLMARICDEDRVALQADLARAANGGPSFERRLRMLDEGAESRWLLLVASPREHGARRDDNRWSGFIQDVTAQEQLVASKQALVHAQLASVLNSVADAVVGANEAGRITHWNRGAERLLGYSVRDAVGQPLSIIVPEGLRELHSRSFERHVATGESHLIGQAVELPALHADGHEVPVELVLSRAEASETRILFGVLRDLTARREAQRERERVLEEERRFAAALIEIGRLLTVSAMLPIERVTEVVAETLNVTRVGVWSLDSPAVVCRDLFDAAEGRHVADLKLEGAGFEPYFEWLRTHRVIDAPDAMAHPALACLGESYLKPLGIVSVLDVSLRADEVDGALSIEVTERRDWSPAEVQFSVRVAELVGRAMDRESRASAEARSRAILSSIGDAVIACDPNYRITLMNPMAEQLTGWSVSEGFGRHLDEVFSVGSSASPRQPLSPETPPDALSSDHLPRSYLVRRDGESLPIAHDVSPITQGGEVSGHVISFRDIRKEEASRRALEHQLRQLHSIGEAIPDLLFTVKTDGAIQYIQRRPSADLLISAEERDRPTLQDIFSESLGSELAAAVSRAVASHETQTVEYALELPQGIQYFEARIARMGDDEVTALVRNVTTEHERARLLDEERARLQAVLASTSAILYAARMPDFEVDYISESATHLLGFSTTEFTQPGFWESALHPDDQARVLEGLGSLLETGVHTHEYRHRHVDGTYRWLRDQVRLFRDEDGVPVRAIGASFDITDRKTAERRLAAAFELQRRVSEFSTMLLSADLVEFDDLVDLWLGSVAEYAHADRAYVFRLQGGLLFNSHEWCKEGVAPQREMLQGIPATDVEFFMTPLSTGSPMIIPSVQALPPEAQTTRELLEAQGIEILLAVPLNYEGQLKGFLGIDNPHVESADELHDLSTPLRVFAEVVAGGLKRADDERELRKLNAQIEVRVTQQRALLELSAALSAARTRDEMHKTLKHHLGRVLGSSRVSLMTLSDDRARVHVSLLDINSDCQTRPDDTFVNEQHPEVELDTEALRPHAVWRALKGGETVSTVDTDVSAYPDWVYLKDNFGLEHFVIVPLSGTDGVFGCFNVCFARSEPVSREEEDWVGQVGSLLAAHLQAHEAQEALARLNLDLEVRVAARTRELRSSEERFTKLFQKAPQAMMLVDPDGRIVRTNAKAEVLFDAEETSLEGLQVEALVPEASMDRHTEMRRAFFEASESRQVADGRIVSALRLDGSTFCAEIGLVVLDLDNRPFIVAGVSDVTARVEAQAAVVQSLREKETMLQEIHHRVKNNLQIISSLLMLQSDQIPSEEVRALLTESVHRVRSMALIHQQLYGVESMERVDMGDYARNLSESLRSALMPSARLFVQAEVTEVPLNDAVPLGLILNELVTNALKYGIPKPGTEEAARVGRAGEGCDVRIELGIEDGVLRLAVLDSGIGLSEAFDSKGLSSLGLRLVSGLTRQLRGEFEYDVDCGSRFVVTYKKSS